MNESKENSLYAWIIRVGWQKFLSRSSIKIGLPSDSKTHGILALFAALIPLAASSKIKTFSGEKFPSLLAATWNISGDSLTCLTSSPQTVALNNEKIFVTLKCEWRQCE